MTEPKEGAPPLTGDALWNAQRDEIARRNAQASKVGGAQRASREKEDKRRRRATERASDASLPSPPSD